MGDSEQQCKDHIFKLAYEYKSSPFANTCQYEDPNYKIAQDLATTCEDGQAQLRTPCKQGNYLQRWYLPLCQNFSTNTTAKSATTSCQVQSSWWSDLVSICKCQDFVTDVDCQMKLVTITT